MLERSRRRGWHVHPSDPTSVRYWDGEGWGRSRDRPAWCVSYGELVVDFEGGLRAEAAAAGAIGVGGEHRRAKPQPARLRPPPARQGSAAGQLPNLGGDGGTARPPWDTSRRPLVLFGLVVIVAVVTLAATIGWSRNPAVDPGPLPSSFVAHASRTCASVLSSPRPSALPTTAADVTAQDTELDALAGQLRSLALGTGAQAVAGWLASWPRYTSVERQRATALGAASGPKVAVLALQARSAADRADSFATANDLQSCAILARPPAGIQAIPS